jgi:hypothetical protein
MRLDSLAIRLAMESKLRSSFATSAQHAFDRHTLNTYPKTVVRAAQHAG